MSDNRLHQAKLMPTLVSEQPSNTEAQVRLALEHMGGRRLGSQQSSQPAHASHGASQTSSNRAAINPGATRHRYVREGEVPVVHASLGRPASRLDHAGVPDKSVLDALRQDIERERGLRETADRALHECRIALTASQTRLAHLEMDLKAAQEQVSVQLTLAQEAHEARIAAEGLHDQANARIASLTERLDAKAEITVRRKPVSRVSQREPQPVKWWVKD